MPTLRTNVPSLAVTTVRMVSTATRTVCEPLVRVAKSVGTGIQSGPKDHHLRGPSPPAFRKHVVNVPGHSERNAFHASVRAALRAGTRAADAATTVTTVSTPARIAGCQGVTP